MRNTMTQEEKRQAMQQLTDCILEVKNKDVNCFLLRFTSLFMDGSYSGYEQYQLNIRKYNRCASDATRLAFCYQCLVYMCKIEFGAFVDKDLIDTLLDGKLTSEETAWFNSELLDRAYHTLSHDVM